MEDFRVRTGCLPQSSALNSADDFCSACTGGGVEAHPRERDEGSAKKGGLHRFFLVQKTINSCSRRTIWPPRKRLRARHSKKIQHVIPPAHTIMRYPGKRIRRQGERSPPAERCARRLAAPGGPGAGRSGSWRRLALQPVRGSAPRRAHLHRLVREQVFKIGR